MASASCLRALFVALLVFNVVANPLALWERFNEDMVEDFLYQARQVGVQLYPCMALHVVRHSMLIMSCVCSYNVQGEPSRQLDAAIWDMVLRELALHLAHFNNSQDLVAFGLLTPATQPASAVVVDKIARYDATT